MKKPYKCWIIWGEYITDGNEPIEYAFATRKELIAFLDGVDAADGWLSGAAFMTKKDAMEAYRK